MLSCTLLFKSTLLNIMFIKEPKGILLLLWNIKYAWYRSGDVRSWHRAPTRSGGRGLATRGWEESVGIAGGILSQAFALYETNPTLAHICPLCQPPIKQTMRIISMLAEPMIACIKSLGKIDPLFLVKCARCHYVWHNILWKESMKKLLHTYANLHKHVNVNKHINKRRIMHENGSLIRHGTFVGTL